MLKYWAYSEKKFVKGTGLGYAKTPEMQWLLLVNPNEEEKNAVSRDFNINKRYFEKYNKATRSKIYSNEPIIFNLIDYYSEGSETKKAKMLFAIEKECIIIVVNGGEKYFTELFEDVSEGLKAKKKKEIEFLLYDFLDRDVAENYDILTKNDDIIAVLEMNALKYGDKKNVQEIINLKRELNKMSRIFWSTSKVVFSIKKNSSIMHSKDSMELLDDIYENLIHQIDIVSNQKESLTDALTIYETTVSNQLAVINNDLNVVMKRLTSVMLLLMVPSVIAGVYGMNFKYLPGALSPYGFFEAIIVMILVTAALYLYFKKKKWV